MLHNAMKSRKQTRKEIQQKNRQQNAIMLVVGVGLILLAVAAFLSLPKATETVAAQQVGITPVSVNFTAPDVSITDLDGNPVSLADYRGKVILYNAWATWCPPCKEEMPTLQAYYEAHKDEGFIIVAIEDGQPVDEVRAFVESYKITFPIWPDVEWKASTAFKIDSLPTSYVIDRDGVARLTWTGAITRSVLEQYVTPIITGN